MHQPFPQHEQRGETYDMRRPEWASVEISVADQMWLDDAYFKEKQMRLEPDAPRAALAYRVSTKGRWTTMISQCRKSTAGSLRRSKAGVS